MTEQHTPLPWRTARAGERIGFADAHITGANRRPVATTLYPLAKSDWRAEDEANARFIVQACNAHDELLAACRLAIPELEAWSNSRDFKDVHDDLEEDDSKALRAIVVVLAKANSP